MMVLRRLFIYGVYIQCVSIFTATLAYISDYQGQEFWRFPCTKKLLFGNRGWNAFIHTFYANDEY